jgi:aarF domain-containing kinase
MQGNIFIGEGGKVSLIDCGQFKSLPRPQRVALAELVLAVAEYQEASDKAVSKQKLADLVRGFGVKLAKGKQDDNDLACAVALFLFGDAGQELPGGYSTNELDEKSPIRLVASFPQELVLLGRATVLLKGIAKRLEVPFSLAEQWSAGCALTLDAASKPVLPLWGKEVVAAAVVARDTDEKIRLSHVASLLKKWGKGKGTRFIERVVRKLPPDLRGKVLEAEVRRQERKASSDPKL